MTIFEVLLTMPKFAQIYAMVCLGIGLLVTPFILGFAIRPILRGWSYGLYYAVLYYKGGAHMGHVVIQGLRAIFVEPILWIGNGSQNSSSTLVSRWYGIFGWHFKKSFNRKTSKVLNGQAKADREAARQKALDDDV